MAICRAFVSVRVRDFDRKSSIDTSKYAAVVARTCAAVISAPPASVIRSLSTTSASDKSTCCLLSEANAVTRMSAPSSSRIFAVICDAIYSITSSGTLSDSLCAFLRKIAIRVSNSGGCTSVIRPHSKRERIRSANPVSCFGGKSEVITTCFW